MAGVDCTRPEVETFASDLACADAIRLGACVGALRESGLNIFELAYDCAAENFFSTIEYLMAGLGPGEKLAFNACWRLDPVRDFGFERKVDAHTPLWLANPYPPEDPHAHERLAKRMYTPIALGQSYFTRYQLEVLFDVQAIGMLQLNLGHTGLTEAFRLSRMAADHGVPVTVRAGESVGPQLAAAVQFAAAIPNSRVSNNPKQMRTANCAASNPIRLLNGKYAVSSKTGPGYYDRRTGASFDGDSSRLIWNHF